MRGILSQTFFDAPYLATYIFFSFLNEPGFGIGINLGIALIPYPSFEKRFEPTTFRL